MHETNEKLKAFFNQNRIPVFGIEKADQLEAEPPGNRPSDLLESAESILCMGVPIPKGIFLCARSSEQMYWRTVNVFYRNIDAALIRAASIIEETGGIAVPVYGCYPFDIKGRGDFWGYLSLVKMAQTVGIGKMGKNGLLFNAEYGPRLLMGGIVTTLKLPPMAWPQRDEKGCPEECTVCQDQCPASAIDKSGRIDRLACVKYSMKSPIFSHFMRFQEVNTEDVQMINHITAIDDHSWYSCIRCVSVCPYI
ncbi:MAG: epoxyqueuosine reductase [Desulfobacteraceae bacterium]|nr:epoxyqueuosine reductase [Desulfobacteraceae bacterium]